MELLHAPMRSRRRNTGRILRGAAFIGVLTFCSAAFALDLPTDLGGLPKDAPPRPRTIAPYPGVHDLPKPRSTPTMTDAEKLKLEKELYEARKRQEKLKSATVKERGAAATARSVAAKEKAQAEAKKKPSAAEPR